MQETRDLNTIMCINPGFYLVKGMGWTVGERTLKG
jgi:hypothetical protein